MPGFDGTGPMGAGSMTGRAMGYCRQGYSVPGTGYNYGRGAGFRRGGRGSYGSGAAGMGFGRRQVSPWNQPVYEQNNITNTADSLNSLKNEADYLKNALDEINRRISEVGKTG